VVAGGAQAAREVIRHPERPARLNGAALAAVPEELALRVLAAEIRDTVGGRDRGPQPTRLHRLEALWSELRPALLAGHHAKRTLGGALITVEPDRSVSITRAPPRRGKPSAVAAGARKGPQARSSRAAGAT